MGGDAARPPRVCGTGGSRRKELLARTYDQLGYRAESGPWRDFYLTGAHELRHGVDATSPGLGGLLGSVPIESVFAAMATQIDGAAADGKHITVNVTFTDLKRSFVLELENSVLHHKEMQPVKGADVTVRLTKDFWLSFLSKQASVKDLVFSDALDIDGDRLALVSLLKLAAAGNTGIPDRHAGGRRSVIRGQAFARLRREPGVELRRGDARAGIRQQHFTGELDAEQAAAPTRHQTNTLAACSQRAPRHIDEVLWFRPGEIGAATFGSPVAISASTSPTSAAATG